MLAIVDHPADLADPVADRLCRLRGDLVGVHVEAEQRHVAAADEAADAALDRAL